jgi:hypothetical protein
MLFGCLPVILIMSLLEFCLENAIAFIDTLQRGNGFGERALDEHGDRRCAAGRRC